MLPLLLLLAQLSAPTALSANVVELTAPTVPTNAVTVSNIQALPNWLIQTDVGKATGDTSLTGTTRNFTAYGPGDERFAKSFASDPDATHFVYDASITSHGGVFSLELDMNQVIGNGDTVIYGIQCDANSGSWDYTANTGKSPSEWVDSWIPSKAPCNPAQLIGTHHIQMAYSHDGDNVTYEAIWVDGVKAPINATVPSGFSLGWASVLLTNFEMDLNNAGPAYATLNSLAVSRW